MGLGILGGQSICFKRKFRWLLNINDVSGNGDGTRVLPPEKSARPSLSFKEIEAQHLNETVYFAGKPEWKPINLTLYDINPPGQNLVFEWLKGKYDPKEGIWHRPSTNNGWKKQKVDLEMYDGCGNIIETWVYENVWPNAIEWGELDMANSEYTTVDLTLRYDRAYIK